MLPAGHRHPSWTTFAPGLDQGVPKGMNMPNYCGLVGVFGNKDAPFAESLLGTPSALVLLDPEW
jgi:hypothetical protein